MDRREFLSTSVVFLLVPLVPAAAACSSPTSESTTIRTTSGNLPGCDGAGGRSSVTSGHQHQVCVPLSDLQNPPVGESTFETSNVESHTHRVVLSHADLEALFRGETRTITTTSDAGHTHQFALMTGAPHASTGGGGGGAVYGART